MWHRDLKTTMRYIAPFNFNATFVRFKLKIIGRGERIRTSDLSVPNRAHYQAVLRPEK